MDFIVSRCWQSEVSTVKSVVFVGFWVRCIWVMETRRIVAAAMRCVPFFAFFLQITSPTSLAFKSVIFFHFRLILQCQWQGEVSIPQIYAIIKSLNCQDYNKGLSYHRNMHFKITWCDSRASGGWFFCNTPVVTVCCYLANTCFVDCITSRLYFSCVCSLICYSNIEILLEQRWLCSKMLSLLVSIGNNQWVGSKS